MERLIYLFASGFQNTSFVPTVDAEERYFQKQDFCCEFYPLSGYYMVLSDPVSSHQCVSIAPPTATLQIGTLFTLG